MDPQDAPPTARVFWLPQADTSAVVLAEAPPALSTIADPRLTADAAFTIGGDGETYVLYDLGNGQRLQLVQHGTPPGGLAVAALVPLSLDGFDRLASVHRLLAAVHGRVVPPDTRLSGQQRARHRRMLQAIDGYRAGATQQEIARVVLRVAPYDRDEWQDASARHTIKSLLKDARAMIAGGYLKLLRHRRRS